jgi:hypothetical protein
MAPKQQTTNCEPRISRMNADLLRFNPRLSVKSAARSLFLGVLVLLGAPYVGQAQSGFGPAQRTLLDAHNCYPERGLYLDRIDRALSTGTPLAIEQDLFYRRDEATGTYEIVVAHDTGALAGAPTLESYFFEKIRPIMEQALRENKRSTWPLITLNLDFKTNQPALLDAVYTLLGKYDAWLTTAPRTATPAVAAPLTVGPLLVLSGSNAAQRVRFHDQVPVGQKLRAFGAIPDAKVPGATDEEQASNAIRIAPEQLIAPRVGNYDRWVNFPWAVVEQGGPTRAGDWMAADSTRLHALVARAHGQGLWIRFYTLDGFVNGDGAGLTKSYNFGGDDAVRVRWSAARATGVDFIATDHYERFHATSAKPR